MQIVIVGLGKVGRALTEQLTAEGHDIVAIDCDAGRTEDIMNVYDVRGVAGNGACYDVQQEAFETGADLLIATTSSDEINMLACLVAKKIGTRHTIARIRDPEYERQLRIMRGELGLSMIINPEKATAREIARVLRPGGRFIVTTPNALMSLTRNPWHVREYTAEELRRLLAGSFSTVETLGVFGDEKVMDYYEENRRSVRRITRFDVLDLQHRLPRRLLQLPYDLLNRLNRRKLLRQNTDLTTSIRMDDYRIGPVGADCFDLFYIATK